MPFNYVLEYVITDIKEIRDILELNETHHLLFYDVCANLLGDNKNTIKKNRNSIRRQSGVWPRSKRRYI